MNGLSRSSFDYFPIAFLDQLMNRNIRLLLDFVERLNTHNSNIFRRMYSENEDLRFKSLDRIELFAFFVDYCSRSDEL
ncbi:unnamed protein product [Dracunculus medinensis]|uniref:Uncharacterized protein n=1 Tax=Dracunculus medinensis TaxID=318479 RepID=A0A0N4U2G5_DRAME|nr:unnamed protein product [Dracunculus medinensis]